MLEKKNRKIFFETPKDKWRVFQRQRLVMFSEGTEVESWDNTQPLYFYPFSWLDYLGKKEVRELFIHDCLLEFAEREISTLDNGKINFEKLDAKLIKIAKEKGHKISVICNLEDLTKEQMSCLSNSDFVRIRVNRNYNNLSILSNLPNEKNLSCIKVYSGENYDYQNIALQSKKMGFNLFHVAKRLIIGSENPAISEAEMEKIKELKELETNQFKVIIPSSLEERFANRFVITPKLGNVYSCDFSKYRLVLKGDGFYPCYTKIILSQVGFKKEDVVRHPKNCLDCACIYENDMLFDIENKMKNYKNPRFALEYIENGK